MNKAIPDIRFYDFEFQLLHVENHFISSNWNIYYNDIGNFESHFDLASDTLPIIMYHDYIIAVQGRHAAIIVGKNLGSDLTVYGRTCNWLLTKRVVDEFNEETKTIDDWMTKLVKEEFEERLVIFDGNAEYTSEVTAERSSKDETFKLVQEILAQKNLGHELQFDFSYSRFVFQILKGNKNPLVISTANRNAYDVTVSSDILDMYTEGFYKPKGEVCFALTVGVVTRPALG